MVMGVVDMEVDKVANEVADMVMDMEVDKVANEVADMVMDNVHWTWRLTRLPMK